MRTKHDKRKTSNFYFKYFAIQCPEEIVLFEIKMLKYKTQRAQPLTGLLILFRLSF